jgi:hypothetical protein
VQAFSSFVDLKEKEKVKHRKEALKGNYIAEVDIGGLLNSHNMTSQRRYGR